MATKKAKVPTKRELAAMRKRFTKAVKDAEKREMEAHKRWNRAVDELSYLEDCVDEAENEVWEADDDLDHFNELVRTATYSGDWKPVVKFKPMKW